MKLIKLLHNFENFTLNVENIEFEKGKILGIIGENGAGKTTFMNAISKNLEVNEILETEDLDNDKILYIPSFLTAYPFLTVSEFLDLILKYNNTNKTKMEILKILELEEKSSTLISDLSDGMSKKLSLAPIFIRNYELLILDEPFNSIDIKYIFELKKYIKELSKNCCILISSHILDTLSDLCTNFYLIKNGNIVKKIDGNTNIRDLESEIFEWFYKNNKT